MTPFEKIGQLQVALDNLNVEYDNLLNLAGKLASGEIEPARVTVDMSGRSWSIAPDTPVVVELKSDDETN